MIASLTSTLSLTFFSALLTDFLTFFDIMIAARADSLVVFIISVNKSVFFESADRNPDFLLPILSNDGFFGYDILDGVLDGFINLFLCRERSDAALSTIDLCFRKTLMY